VSDLNEIEQWELAKRKAKELWIYVVAGVALGLGALGAWNWWHDRRDAQAETASARYQELINAYGRLDTTRGQSLLDELKSDYAWTPYPALGSLIAARAQVEANELDKAAESLRFVMDKAGDEEMQMVARLRLARVLSAQAKNDEALNLLTLKEPGAFTARVADVRGDVLLAKGDREGALREYMAARTADTTRSLDLDLLDLKIRDLGGTPPATPLDGASGTNEAS
jgi:predicted negative regulator of RcsB-dependent stress response